MKMPFALIASLALAVCAGNAPAGAVTTNSGPSAGDRTVTFNTAFTPQYYGAGEYDGVLHLVIAPDGTLSGWYRSADEGRIRTVTGGLDGDKIWLNLGSGQLFDIQGTYDNGKIDAATYLGNQLYAFTATPTKS